MNVGLEVLVDGRPVPTVSWRGSTYLPVPRLGAEYELRVWNRGPRRVTALVSVDGLSVTNTEPESEVHPGYIVSPGDSIVIRGWRRDRDTVAAFSFEERERSYAARIGRPEKIGIIRLLAIEEQTYRPTPRPWLEEKAAGDRAALRWPREVGGTGTGYGRDLDSPVYLVPFVRSSNRQTATLYYDTPRALRRTGLPLELMMER
jgi:hypothetical protein